MRQNSWKCNGYIGSEIQCTITSYLFFCKCLRTSCCISPINFKKPTILPETVGFLKIVWVNTTGIMERFTKKWLGDNYALKFTFFYRYLVKMALAVYLIFCKFVESTIRLITETFDLQK